MYSGTLSLAAGTLNLNGHKLTIAGDLLQSGGTVFVNGGELEVQGDYKLMPLQKVNNGILNMTDNADIVRVHGNFVMQSNQSHDGKLSAGTLEIGGDLIQSGSNYNFHTTGDHTVLLNGNIHQTVDLYNNSTANSRITNLKIENTSDEGVKFKNYVYVVGSLYNTDSLILTSSNICVSAETRFADNVWDNDITMEGNVTFSGIEIGGNLYVKRNVLNLGGNICVKKSIYMDKNVNLCGYTLDVGGDVWVGANLLLNKGSLNIGGDFNVSSTNGNYTSGYLTMKYDEDYVGVAGDMLFFSNSSSNSLTAGTIEIKGNFTQKYNSRENNFYPSSKHQVVLSGDKLQKIKFDSNKSRFNILDVRNASEAGVEFLSEVNVIRLIDNDCNIHHYDIGRNNRALSSDEVVNGDMLLESGTLNLDGHTLTISGNLIQTGGILNINGGTLEIQGDYLIRKTSGNSYYSSDGKLLMTKESDVVRISGDFVMQSNVSHKNCLTNGVLEVGGSFSQLSGASDNFLTSGNHTVVLNGSEAQTIDFYSGSTSVVTNLKIDNTSEDGVTFKSTVYIAGMLYNTDSVVNNSENIYAMSNTTFENNEWNHSISFSQNRQLPDNLKIRGDVYIRANISLPDNSEFAISKAGFSSDQSDCYTFLVGKSIYILRSSLNINGGSAFVGSNLFFGTASDTYGGINMVNADDYVLINGNVYHYSSSNYNYLLSDGTLELKGDFIQNGSFSVYNPVSTEFKLLLSGSALQTIKTESSYFSFGTIDVNNHSEDGVFFASLFNASDLKRNGCNLKFAHEDSPGWTLSEDEIFDGDLTISRGTLDLNGHKLTVNGNLTQSGGIVFINGGELVVDGDYRIQNKSENEYTDSNGELKMTNSSDIVQVSGDFVMQSIKPYTTNLSAGSLEIGGDFLAPNGIINTFYCSGSHTVVLNGSNAQKIQIYNGKINNLKIANTSDEGVSIENVIYVAGILYNSESNIVNSRDICAVNSTVFENNKWNNDISFSTSVSLTSTLYINGDVYVNYDSSLNSGSLAVNPGETYKEDVLGIEGVDSGDYTFIVNGSLYLRSMFGLPYQGSAIIAEDIYIESLPNNYYNGGYISLNSDSKIFIGGDLKSSSVQSSSFGTGTLEIRGDIIFSNERGEFKASGGHTTIFSGDNLQTVSVAAPGTQFDVIELRNPSDEGVRFETMVSYSELIDNGYKIAFGKDTVVGWKLTDDEIIDGNINLVSGILDLNGHELTVKGNLVQLGGTVNINGGSLNIAGDYRIQCEIGEKPSDSLGILKMTNESDNVKVLGSLIMQSSYSHKDYLTAGTLEIGGDLLQCGYSNFQTSGLHTVILNGVSPQRVNFGSSNVSSSHITNLKIQNTSAQGVELETTIYVTGKLFNTSSKIINGKNLRVIDTTDFIDNAWSADVYFEKTPTLLPNFYLDGSLYLNSILRLSGNMSINGTVYANSDIDLNGYILDVEKDVWLNSQLNVNSGKLYVGNDLNICNDNFGLGKGCLNMNNNDDYVLVNSGMYIYSSKKTNLLKGILEVKGNFTQKDYKAAVNLSSANKTILSGNNMQSISVESADFIFDTLEIAKPLSAGYVFSRTPMWNALVENYTDSEPLKAPSKLQFLGSTSKSIHMKWDKPSENTDECIYDVYRDGKYIASTKDTEYIDQGLVSYTEYSYYVIVRNASGNVSEPSNTLLAQTNSSALLPPDNFGFKIRYDGSIILSWTSPANSDDTVEYNIYRNGTLIATTKSSVYTDTNIEQGYYEYYVEAVNESLSSMSDSVFIDTMPPEAPIIFAEEINDNKVVLNWSCKDNLAVSYYILYKNGTLYRTLTKNYYVDTSFSSDSESSYYVIAYDAAGNASEESNTVSFIPVEDQAPPEVTELSYDNDKLSDANSIIRVNCKDDTALSEFVAEIKPVNSEEWVIVYRCTVSKTSDIVEFSVKNAVLESGNYEIRITLKDYSENTSIYEDDFDYVKNELIEPIVTAVMEGNITHIEWTSASEMYDITYYIYRRCGDDDYECIKKTNELSFADSGVSRIDTSKYYVVAMDPYGNQIRSDSVSVYPSSDTVKPEIHYISCDGKTLSSGNNSIRVNCSDDAQLSNITAEIRAANTDEWSVIESQSTSKASCYMFFSLDDSALKSGEYVIRITAVDAAGNQSMSEAAFNYAANTLIPPEINAHTEGCNISLSWTAAKDNETVRYSIFRVDASGDDTKGTCIGYTENTSLTDNGLNPLVKYGYYVVAYDENYNTVKSEICNATTGGDNVNPIANAESDETAIVGYAVRFDGSRSTDNYDIKSYKWDFGDGTSDIGKTASHVYSDKGTYTVTLTVTDESGNEDTDTVTVEVYDNSYSMLEITVTDDKGKPLPDASAYCEQLAYSGNSMSYADENGLISLVAKEGTYSFYFYVDINHIPEKLDINLNGGINEITVVLMEAETVTAEFDYRDLDIEEIKDLGIDVNKPENQFVTEMKMKIDGKTGKIYLDLNGEAIKVEYNDYVTDEPYLDIIDSREQPKGTVITSSRISTLKSGTKMDIPNSSAANKTIVNMSVTEFSWLKDFYEVSITFTNNADENFDILNPQATLILPNGLSLADTNDINSARRTMNTLKGGTSETVSWIVRGDAKGSYNISVDFEGQLSPFGYVIKSTFEGSKSINVIGGDALKLTLNISLHEAEFTLTNISDKDVYNAKANMGSYNEFNGAQRILLVYPSGLIEKIEWEDEGRTTTKSTVYFPVNKDPNTEIFELRTLKPGANIIGKLWYWPNVIQEQY